MSSTEVVVTVCASPEDCDEVAALCGSSFPEEVWSQGLSVQEWSTIEAEDLRNTPSWWRQIGLARDGIGGRLLGVVVLTLEHEADDSISWSEYSSRVGCRPTILSWCYDQVLDEPLLEHECLIDFIAVSPEARGRGVGAKLMQWAEGTGAAILAETETAAVAAHGVDMTLWVAADNSVACRLYQRAGYAVVRRTDSGACNCMASAVLKWFLGHPVWIKMRKRLPAPPHLAAAKPQPQTIALTAAAGATLTCVAADADAPFVEVPLGASLAAVEQALLQELPSPTGSRRIRGPAAPAAGAPPPAAGAAGMPAPRPSSLAQKQLAAGQHPATPKIAAVGGGLQALEGQRPGGDTHGPAGGRHSQPSQGKEGQVVELHALASSTAAENVVGCHEGAAGCCEDAAGAAGEKLAALYAAAGAAAAAAHPCSASAATASVASISATSDVGDSDAGEGEAAAVHASTCRGSAAAAGADVFELVSLQSDAAAAAAAPA